jgi:hypothetical protein
VSQRPIAFVRISASRSVGEDDLDAATAAHHVGALLAEQPAANRGKHADPDPGDFAEGDRIRQAGEGADFDAVRVDSGGDPHTRAERR